MSSTSYARCVRVAKRAWIDDHRRPFTEVDGFQRRLAELLGKQLQPGRVRHSIAFESPPAGGDYTSAGASSVPTAS